MFWKKKTKGIVDEKKIDELLSRAVVEVIVKEDLKKALHSGRQLRVKLGIDPTSPHLHLGRAVTLLKLRDFQELGHQIVFIVGDFTAIIGDTSDKDGERPMLSRDVIEKNKKSYFREAGKLIDLSRVETRYNGEWLERLSYREIGEHADLFSVADFTARENIRRRLDVGTRVSLREVLYPLMQGYDSVAVRADVELGGTDQKFNLLAGRTLQEKYKQRPQNILMGPLIPGLDGRKMSSSWGNTINITDAPQEMYGKVMRMRDEHLGDYLVCATRIPYEEATRIAREVQEGSIHPKDAKMRLAREIVSLYHGPDTSRDAERMFIDTFVGKNIPDDAPVVHVPKGTVLAEALKDVVVSKSELRRLLAEGAVEEVGGQTYREATTPITKNTDIKVGKRRFVKVRVV